MDRLKNARDESKYARILLELNKTHELADIVEKDLGLVVENYIDEDQAVLDCMYFLYMLRKKIIAIHCYLHQMNPDKIMILITKDFEYVDMFADETFSKIAVHHAWMLPLIIKRKDEVDPRLTRKLANKCYLMARAIAGKYPNAKDAIKSFLSAHLKLATDEERQTSIKKITFKTVETSQNLGPSELVKLAHYVEMIL